MAKKESKKKNKHTTPAQRKRLATAFIERLEKTGGLNPSHTKDFEFLVDDMSLPVTKKK